MQDKIKLAISNIETMVFGDFINDLEMMETTEFSFAMKNAHKDVVKISNYKTDFDYNTYGVRQTIEKYLL
ncbi:HAD family hydrolase [Flavobacterium sp.]|uniref:HAD family hydrolase n=1 Tax=Flavobacterium sp. TaxID=239 RepID=UPI0037BF249D